MRYILSVEQTDLSARRARWKTQKDRAPRQEHFGIAQAPHDPPGGLLAIIDETGRVERSRALWGPEGILEVEGGFLVGCPWDVRRVDGDLVKDSPFFEAPWLNYVHSLRRTRRGVIGASTGLDLLFEVSSDGQVLWQWWAVEHGFDHDPSGMLRTIDRQVDHRGIKYDTRLHTTHVNAAVEIDDIALAATLFHQGQLIQIDRESGAVTTLLDGLKRPHAVRHVTGKLYSLSDTGNGRALLITIRDGYAVIEQSVALDTTWLQDAYFDGRRWLLVDGLNARVVHANAQGTVVQTDQLELDWRLYEAIPFKSTPA